MLVPKPYYPTIHFAGHIIVHPVPWCGFSYEHTGLVWSVSFVYTYVKIWKIKLDPKKQMPQICYRDQKFF